MDHGAMDHSAHAGHEGMDHSAMDHSGMDHSGMGHGGGGVHMMEMMQMTFYASTNVTLLFDFWKTTNAGQLVGSCVAVFVIALLFEALRAYREVLYTRYASSERAGSNAALVGGASGGWMASMLKTGHLIQTLLYGLQITIGYLLMLIFMAYNAYICIAVILGAMTGFLVFGWQKCLMLEMTADHCG